MKKVEKTAGQVSNEISESELKAKLAAKKKANLDAFVAAINDACEKYNCDLVAQTLITGGEIKQAIVPISLPDK